jgi:hypothetical protein
LLVDTIETLRHVVEVEANSEEEATAQVLASGQYGDGVWVYSEEGSCRVADVEENEGSEQ